MVKILLILHSLTINELHRINRPSPFFIINIKHLHGNNLEGLLNIL